MTHGRDPDLTRLFRAAVDDVEPQDRIGEIRARTQAAAPSPWRRRTTIGGAVLATAAVVSAIAVLPSLLDDPPPPPLVAPTKTQTVPAYFVGDTPRGPRLYREFLVVDDLTPRLLASLRALEGSPTDPDYDTLWRPGSFLDAQFSQTDRVIIIDLVDGFYGDGVPGSDSPEYPIAVQQAIYTAQGAVGEGRVPVRFRVDGQPTDTVFGVPAANPINNTPIFDTLSTMNISYPFEGAEVKGSFTSSGVNNSFESSVIWRLEDAKGQVVTRGHATAQGWGESRLFPWETEVDVSGLAPGDYTFIAENDDPSGGTEGNGPDSDTRSIVIE